MAPTESGTQGWRPATRILMYSHDTYGLGHLRRSFLLAGQLVTGPKVDSVLITTGSPRAQSFGVPEGCDTVKLPALTKGGEGAYEARTLGVPLEDILHLRSEVILGTFEAYRPDVLVVDHAPVGVEGELWPLFRRLRHHPDRPQLVLGLRDIIDDVGRVVAEWDRLDAWTALDEVFDRILVYGDPAVLTTAQELGLPARFPDKVRFTGYLTRPLPDPVPTTEPTILVTVGGGGDGTALLDAYVEFLGSLGPTAGFRSVIVTGPLADEHHRHHLTVELNENGVEVDMREFVEGIEQLASSAAGVISMAGYNTVTELLGSRAQVMLVPRTQPRLEQAIRAERLGPVAGFEVAAADASLPSRIASFVANTLGSSGPRPVTLPLRTNGQVEASHHIMDVLSESRKLDAQLV